MDVLKNVVSSLDWNYYDHDPPVVVIVVHIDAVLPVLEDRSQAPEETVLVAVQFPSWPWSARNLITLHSSQIELQNDKDTFVFFPLSQPEILSVRFFDDGGL